jgi:hypothetical protein
MVKRAYCEWIRKEAHTQSKGYEQSEVKYSQDHSANLIANELADPFPGLPYFS